MKTGMSSRASTITSLRAALLAIASQLGADPTSGTVTLTFAPSFLPIGDEPPWSLSMGVATKPREAGKARGWFPLQLPEGVRLQSMTVIGRKTGAVEIVSGPVTAATDQRNTHHCAHYDLVKKRWRSVPGYGQRPGGREQGLRPSKNTGSLTTARTNIWSWPGWMTRMPNRSTRSLRFE